MRMNGWQWLRHLAPLFLLSFLAACGGSGSSDLNADSPVSTQGVAVDPYIRGAVFQEVTAQGLVLQTSSPSDDRGRFNFSDPVQAGSIIEMKNDQRGLHLGIPFQGLLKRQVGADAQRTLVASPLTTLLANGATAEEVTDFLSACGLPGFTSADLLADPMAELENLPITGVTAQHLRKLQANMATQTLLHLLNDYTAGSLAIVSSTNRQLMSDLVAAVEDVLDPIRLTQMADILAADPELGGHPMALDDALHFAGGTMQQIADLADAGAMPSRSTIQDCLNDALVAASETLRSQMRKRLGIADPNPDPTDPPPATPDGQAVFTAQCSSCHNVGSSSDFYNLAGDGAKVQSKLAAGAHMGQSPNAAEIEAIADYVDGAATSPSTPEPPPGATTPPPPSYADCTACHGHPPTGSASPNSAGAHAAHDALPGLSGQCHVCHQDASHNGWVDLKFPTAYDAKSGPAHDNGDGTCSNLSCHGGRQTPDWWSGSINVGSECTSCHSSGTGQYNGYSSGRHNKHWNEGIRNCTSCHDTAKLASTHFAGLDSSAMDTPAATIGGGSTRISSYSSRNCTTSCHGRENW